MLKKIFYFIFIMALIISITNCPEDISDSGSSSDGGSSEPDYDYYVDAVSGSDSNDGSKSNPFKTLTYAAANAGTNVTIKIRPGNYDAANGETFPIVLQAGQELIGDVSAKGDGGTETLVNGSAVYNTSYLVTIVSSNNSKISGLKIRNTTLDIDYYGIYNKDITVEIFNNTFSYGYAGLHIENVSNGKIYNNVFTTSSYGIRITNNSSNLNIYNNNITSASLPIDIVTVNGLTVISNNTVTGSGQVGININYGNPQIIENTFNKSTGYTYGAVCVNDAFPKIRDNIFQCDLAILIRNNGSPNPDIGMNLSGDEGGNDFSAVTGYSIQVESGVTTANIYAVGNTFPNNPPDTTDIDNNGSGKIWYGTGASDSL